MTAVSEPKAPNAEQRREVTRADLPVHCPMDTAGLWSEHPRVYLPLEESADHQARCPYCGALYVLKD